MVELGVLSTSAIPTSFCYNEFPRTVKLLVTVTVTGMLTRTITEAGKSGRLLLQQISGGFCHRFSPTTANCSPQLHCCPE
jgi:hypothetical protein